MSVSKRLVSVVLAFALLCGGAVASAQDAAKKDRSGGYSAIIDNLDMLIDNYAKFLGRKYDLTEDQDAFTKQVLRDRAHGFLDKHEDDLRDLFDQLFEARSGGDMSPEALVAWGQRVMPIYEEAKKIIVDGNKEWAEILTDEQKKIHSDDLRLMDESFATTEGVLGRIVKGDMSLEEFRNPRFGRVDRNARASLRKAPQHTPAEPVSPPAEGEVQPQTITKSGLDSASKEKPTDAVPTPPVAPPGELGQPIHTPQPIDTGNAVPAGDPSQPHVEPPVPGPDRRGTRPTGPKTGKNFESEWEKYVREFIARYNLDDEQAQRANTILADCQQQAERYLGTRRSDIEQMEKREKELKEAKPAGGKAAASDAPDRSKELADITKRKDEAMKPVADIFEKTLKPRLEKLPTRAQRKAAEDAAAKGKAAGAPAAGKAAKSEPKPADGPKSTGPRTPKSKAGEAEGAKPADEPKPETTPESKP